MRKGKVIIDQTQGSSRPVKFSQKESPAMDYIWIEISSREQLISLDSPSYFILQTANDEIKAAITFP